MSRPSPLPARARLRRALGAATGGALAVAAALSLCATAPVPVAPASAATARTATNVVTPGDFLGYGFDQCLAPSQRSMNRWLQHSPFLAVGIYISGDSRACRSQPNLTPTWISRQLSKGWKLLPITLGPQASCNPRFPRYGDDKTIIPKPGATGRYPAARRQGSAEAAKTVGVATDLGIAPGSTLWYDIEAFDLGNTRCRESALAFLSSWTTRIHKLGYVSGVYSSAGSGIKMLDDARVNRPDQVVLPDQIWLARWDGKANTSTSYVRSDGWQPHSRVKQYQGGHNETWGGVTINIDRNFLDVGRGMYSEPETHCDGVRISYRRYPTLNPPTTSYVPPVGQVKALQCLLSEQGLYKRRINGTWTNATVTAIEAWQSAHGSQQQARWTQRDWMTLLSAGDRPVLKFGSTGPAVRRLQRTLNAAAVKRVPVNGLFGAGTQTALRAWQQRVRTDVSGIAAGPTWRLLASGRY